MTRSTESTVVYECDTCRRRAPTPHDIDHNPTIHHPDDVTTTRYEFPIRHKPRGGLFRGTGEQT